MERLLKTQQDIDEFLFWVVCLQEEVLPKGRGSLQTYEGYCCLGVGIVCIVENPKTDSNNVLLGNYPDDGNSAPKWLININYDFGSKYGKSLSLLNDSLVSGWTHKQIGDKLLEVYKDQLTL